jgi:hypothetical protein
MQVSARAGEGSPGAMRRYTECIVAHQEDPMPAAKKKTGAAPATKAPVRRTKPRAVAAPKQEVAPTPAAAAKADKPAKLKVLRDSFTILKSEYEVLETLKERAQAAGRPAKKSEVLRAGVRALAAMDDQAFLAALRAVPALKPNSPAKR